MTRLLAVALMIATTPVAAFENQTDREQESLSSAAQNTDGVWAQLLADLKEAKQIPQKNITPKSAERCEGLKEQSQELIAWGYSSLEKWTTEHLKIIDKSTVKDRSTESKKLEWDLKTINETNELMMAYHMLLFEELPLPDLMYKYNFELHLQDVAPIVQMDPSKKMEVQTQSDVKGCVLLKVAQGTIDELAKLESKINSHISISTVSKAD